MHARFLSLLLVVPVPVGATGGCAANDKVVSMGGNQPGTQDGGNQAQECAREDCKPAIGMPNWECADGGIGGPACKRQANGSCGWEIVDCPPKTGACDQVPQCDFLCPPGTKNPVDQRGCTHTCECVPCSQDEVARGECGNVPDLCANKGCGAGCRTGTRVNAEACTRDGQCDEANYALCTCTSCQNCTVNGCADDSGSADAGSVDAARDALPDGCITDWGTDGGPVGTHCGWFSQTLSHYDASTKRVVVAAPALAPIVSGSYTLTYEVAKGSGSSFYGSNGAIRIMGAAVVVDLSAEPDVDQFPVVSIAFCNLTLVDVCGVTHTYSDTGVYSDRGCALFTFRRSADSGANLISECTETRDCRTRCR
jgi:hypothetical protein